MPLHINSPTIPKPRVCCDRCLATVTDVSFPVNGASWQGTCDVCLEIRQVDCIPGTVARRFVLSKVALARLRDQ
jgi:hypothetical protein